MRRWPEAYPERLAFELAEFERLGLSFTLDAERLQRTGTVLLAGTLPLEDGAIELLVAYPDSFPFMRPEVFAPSLRLERHQNPAGRNLCLLERSTRAWDVADTAAWLVAERVPYLLALLEAGGEELLAGEAPQGEPASAYFEGESGTVVFIAQEMLVIPREHSVGLMQLAAGVNEPPQRQLRVALAKVSVRTHGAKKQVLAELSEPLKSRFAGNVLDGRWVRLQKLPYGNKPRDLLGAIAEVEPALENPRWQSLPGGGEISVLGALVTEELRQGQWEDSWIFVASIRESAKKPGVRYVIRGERLTAPDLQDRLPAQNRVSERAVGILGLGSLGAPVAAELLHAQVGELRVLDFDRVEAGNIVRWTHGVSAVGHHKSNVIAGWAASEYPFTSVTAYNLRIGGVSAPDAEPIPGLGESAALQGFLDGLDIVIDATGELGVQHLLATLAHELKLTQVYAWGTEGGWGGAVACISATAGGCWLCLQLAFEDGTIALPPAAPDPPVQPRGCAEPTFAASGYALSPIVAQASRAAARMLHGQGHGEVHVCTLQETDGELPAPRWESTPIPTHERCPCEHYALSR